MNNLSEEERERIIASYRGEKDSITTEKESDIQQAAKMLSETLSAGFDRDHDVVKTTSLMMWFIKALQTILDKFSRDN